MGDDYDYDAYLDRSDKNNWRAGSMPNIQSAPRRAGKASMSASMSAGLHSQSNTPPRLITKTPREIESVLRQVEDRGVLVFMSGERRFSYAALGIRGGRWFITGAGQFYGKNEFTRDEFIEVLMHPEVGEIWTSFRFEQVY